MSRPSLRRLAHKYGFTESEARAVVLISIAALAGIIISSISDMKQTPFFRDEYRRVDSMFNAQLSQQDVSFTPVTVGGAIETTHASLLDINTATAQDFEALPGIGPVIARRIIDYREKHGDYSKLDDLIKVKSIGKKKFQQIETYICIGE